MLNEVSDAYLHLELSQTQESVAEFLADIINILERIRFDHRRVISVKQNPDIFCPPVAAVPKPHERAASLLPGPKRMTSEPTNGNTVDGRALFIHDIERREADELG